MSTMKAICQVCNQPYRGIALNTVKDGKQVEVCPTCYKTLDAEYRKNSCLACVFFKGGSCDLFGTDLEEPYLQNAKCEFFTTSSDPKVIEAVKEKATAARKKIKEPAKPRSLDELVAVLAERGQTLTYFCCHCGSALKVGANQEIHKTCPRCEYDLSAIDLAKLINQHL
ncbi:MAG: hypothetical protein NWE93_14870 [Candidatus Bathyarchaeota archaeon]|nr:hypothetical protein [Candidatus Bathyarchaeota archaeon]